MKNFTVWFNRPEGWQFYASKQEGFTDRQAAITFADQRFESNQLGVVVTDQTEKDWFIRGKTCTWTRST